MTSVFKYTLRGFYLVLVIYLTIMVQDKLDIFLSLVGSLLCAPIAFIIPTLCHYKIVAQTSFEKIEDLFILAISFAIFVFCTITTALSL